ncbi:PH domain-containing protein [Pseudomonas sp. UMAB-40]|uniref:PH domain-containing protein n=1 Tax=Pseudomonas sp. UMAB-40 TaxID=1365407 RepID=UPI001C590D04|nr:PH domain-containing protein [Pseudomonas sp. UMAB-40]
MITPTAPIDQPIASPKLHWIEVATTFVPVTVAALIALLTNASLLLSCVLLCAPAGLFVRAVAAYLSTTIILHKHGLALSSGVLWRDTIDLPISRIESVEMRQSLLARWLDYGSLTIRSVGGGVVGTANIKAPEELRKQIYLAMSLSIG